MAFALEIENLSKHYPRGTVALNSVSLKVAQGDFFALLGPNGAGKSTLISIICSLVQKSAGKVHIGGIDIDRDFPKARRKLGVVPQEFNFNSFEKARDIVVNQAGYYGIARAQALDTADHYLDQLGLWEKRDEASRFLSGGMKRRLMIARALVHEPELLVLDEPTAGVDIELRRSMWSFLEKVNAQGTTIILTTHYLEEAESLCRNVAILDRGVILEDSSMASLLQKLHRETFVLDLGEALQTAPELTGIDVIQSDDARLELTLNRGDNLNGVFDQLSQQGISVLSMRNKANRLEELFVDLLKKSGGES
jgi:ABC-2 type transport system ATP-binding protein